MARSGHCAASDDDHRHALPEDAIYEILLRLPAKDLCRLRAVCRPWRSLLSDPAFAAAHAARHPEPLVLAGYHATRQEDGGVLFDILDLSGHVVRRVRQESRAGLNDDDHMISVKSVHGDLICLVNRSHGHESCRLLDLATGAVVCVLPEELAEEHVIHKDPHPLRATHRNMDFAFGQVPTTGEHKVLRVLRYEFSYPWLICEVFTIDGSGHGRWRARASPPHNVVLRAWSSVTINGIVYFLSMEIVERQDFMVVDTVAPFDLESEEWMPTIRGPLCGLVEAEKAAGLRIDHTEDWGAFSSLVVLNGCLVLALRKVHSSSMDLWFLIDAKRGSWVKQHSINYPKFNYRQERVYPLFVLNDGRIVFISMRYDKGLVRIYDPRIGISTDVAEIGPCGAVSLYTGNLLSLAN